MSMLVDPFKQREAAFPDQVIPGQVLTVAAPRVMSIDIFRGITMTVMIFVNELAGVSGTPWWTEHAPGRADYMTYVDMVFPFFLFIVGMSMPLSITQRLRKNPSMPALWLHVITRFVSLLMLGLILANAENADRARMGMSGGVWALLAILSAGLYLNVYGKSAYGKPGKNLGYARVLKAIGILGMVVLFAIYRRSTADGKPAWLEFGYPEILGLIAYSYLAVAVVFIPTRRWRWAAPMWLVLFLAFNVASAGYWTTSLGFGHPGTVRLAALRLAELPWWYWPFSNGSMTALIMAGIIASWIFLGWDGRPSPGRAMTIGAVLGVLMIVAGWISTPLGISKIRATPTWTLYSMGGAMLMFTLLYWICDIKRRTGWAWLFRPAGSNTLTTYLLPDVWYYLAMTVGFTWYDRHFNLGWPALVKTMVFTVFILLVAAGLTKARVRLQL